MRIYDGSAYYPSKACLMDVSVSTYMRVGDFGNSFFFWLRSPYSFAVRPGMTDGLLNIWPHMHCMYNGVRLMF